MSIPVRLTPRGWVVAVALTLGLVLLSTVDPVAAASAPQLSGLDLAGMDRGVLPGNDFFAYTNGKWLKTTPIPPDRSSWGLTDTISEQTHLQVKALLEEAAAAKGSTETPQRKAGDLYASYMDEGTIEKRGLAPLSGTLKAIAALQDKTALSRLLGEQLRVDVDALNNTNFQTDHLFGLWVAPSFGDPEHYAAYLLQGGLGLPDREYYLSISSEMGKVREQYQAHIARLLRLAAIPDGEAKAERILALETRMAQVHATRAESLDVTRANNPWPRAEFPRRAPGLDWVVFFEAAGLADQEIVFAWHPAATTGLSALVGSEPLSTWKEWLTFHAIDRRSGALPRAFVEEGFAFYGKVLSGTPQQSVRWKRGVTVTNSVLGDAVGQLYVQRHFPPESKVEVQAMVKAIVEAFRTRIDGLEWMAPATKAQAKAKLDTLYIGVGYPEHWTDYGPLKVDRRDLFGNLERSSLFETRRWVARLGKAVDRTEWCMTPQTVNAVNLPLQNALNFPAAGLQPPFFDARSPAAINFGDVGATIGHEISHSFDDQGAMFDARGKLHNWWTTEDLAHFQAAGAALAAQYDRYRPLADLSVNGKQTLSENIADVAGLSAAHDAWLASLSGARPPETQGFSGEQQFFVSYAQSWRTKYRDPALRQLVVADGHAPDEYRADTVRNLDPWYPAFDVKAGQALFLAPPERVRIW